MGIENAIQTRYAAVGTPHQPFCDGPFAVPHRSPLGLPDTLRLFRQSCSHAPTILQEIQLLSVSCRNNPVAGIMPVIPPTELPALIRRRQAELRLAPR